MDATQTTPAAIGLSHTHPLLLVAAASVTAVSLAGVGVLAGWLPGPGAHAVEPARMAPVAVQSPAATPVPVPAAVVVPLAKAAPKANPKPSERAVARHASPLPEAGLAAPAPLAVSPAPSYSAAPPMPPICRDCGVVEAVNEVKVEPKTSGGGAITGGIVGGVVGNQFGKGATRDIATILGAVGGAYAGNHIEKSTKESKRYDVVVRFEDGSARTFSSDTPPAWQSGDRVRLQNGLLTMGGGRTSGSGAI